MFINYLDLEEVIEQTLFSKNQTSYTSVAKLQYNWPLQHQLIGVNMSLTLTHLAQAFNKNFLLHLVILKHQSFLYPKYQPLFKIKSSY